MNTEYKFLKDSSVNVGNRIPEKRERRDIYDRLPENLVLFYKSNQNNNNSLPVNSIKNNIYNITDDGDPYVKLLTDFNGLNGKKSLKLTPADFAYLTDLGVYPLNRLVILRRFPEGTVVPGNLTEWGDNGPEPIATVVGWIKEGTNDLFNITFSENWVDISDTLDKVFNKIMKEEYSQKIENIMSVPGWSQGFLWGFLNKMGLSTDTYDWRNVPHGDPNVLKQSKTRDIYSSQGLRTDFSITLETEYEQKFINNIDSSSAMLDIINNLTTFGTSNMNFYLKPNSQMVGNLISAINSSGKDGNLIDWVNFVTGLFKNFFEGIRETYKEVKSVITNTSEGDTDTSEGGTDTGTESNNNQSIYQRAEKSINQLQSFQGSLNNFTGGIKNLILGGLDALLAGTVNKYRWEIRGSLAFMTGLPTTPWHMTIGNPYQPVVSLNNIYVDNVSLTPGQEMGLGDVPTRLKVSITAKISRPLGKQEIDRIFNNSYRRVYSKLTDDTKNKLGNDLVDIVTNNTGQDVSDEVKQRNINSDMLKKKNESAPPMAPLADDFTISPWTKRK